jgi:hypothetical protein
MSMIVELGLAILAGGALAAVVAVTVRLML